MYKWRTQNISALFYAFRWTSQSKLPVNILYVCEISPTKNKIDRIAYEAFKNYTSGDQDIQIYGFL
jgi:hypothetical protein